MSKLSASHLFDAMRSSYDGQNLSLCPPRAPRRLSVEELASFLERGTSPRSGELTPQDLAHAIRRTFDLDHDRVVADPSYLLDLPTVPAGRRLRFDPSHHQRAENGRQNGRQAIPDDATDSRTLEEDLSTALGVAQARELLHGSNWIIVVVDARLAISAVCQHAMRLLSREPHVLVVCCEGGGTLGVPLATASGQSLDELLVDSGLAHLGPLDGLNADDLSEIFQALKQFGRSCLVRLRVTSNDSAADGRDDVACASEQSERLPIKEPGKWPERSGRPSPWAAESPEAVEAALAEIAAAEPAVVVVDLRPRESSDRLKDRLGKRFVVAENTSPHLWQWCAGLVAGGCRPWLLISDEQWFETAVSLAALPEVVELRATAIVFDRSGRRPPRRSGPGAFLREATFAAAGDIHDFERLLSFSLAQSGLMLIWAPPLADAKAGRRLRVDAAQSAWLRRQHRAGLAEHRQIVAAQFSDELAPWISAYEEVGQRRSFIWKWCLHGVELTTLSCVPDNLRRDACDTKVLAGMFNVLVDDVADQQGNAELLAALRRLVHSGDPQFERFDPVARRYGEFTRQVWGEVWRRAKRYSCYDPYASLLEFDLAQLFNTVHYSHLVNSNPYILNVVEHDDYSPQGMGLLSFAMIDLMCSPQFVANELGKLREAMWHAQWMARIGNLISTWQREVADRDFSSGVFAHAVAERDLTIEQLLSGDREKISAAIQGGGHEAYFLRRWKQHRARFLRLLHQLQSVDLAATARGLERLLQTELVSRGEK
jgi:hypothetical protein